MRILVIFAMIFAIAQAVDPVPRRAPNPKADTGDLPSASATSAAPQGADSNIHGKDGWDKAGILANDLLVVVGSGGLVAAFRTLIVIRRQTNLSEVAAFAAKARC